MQQITCHTSNRNQLRQQCFGATPPRLPKASRADIVADTVTCASLAGQACAEGWSRDEEASSPLQGAGISTVLSCSVAKRVTYLTQAMLPVSGGPALMPADAFAGAPGLAPSEMQPPLQALKEEEQFHPPPPPPLMQAGVAGAPAVEAHLLQDASAGASMMRAAPPPLPDTQFNAAPSPLLPPSVEQARLRARYCTVYVFTQ